MLWDDVIPLSKQPIGNTLQLFHLLLAEKKSVSSFSPSWIKTILYQEIVECDIMMALCAKRKNSHTATQPKMLAPNEKHTRTHTQTR